LKPTSHTAPIASLQYLMRWIINSLVIFVLPSLMSFSCDSLPMDQKGTVQRIAETHELRVGLVENPPFVVRDGDEPRGVEVEAIKSFAESQNAHPVWTWGGEQKLMKQLEHYEMDLVAGGLKKDTPWKSYVGMTDTYTGTEVIATPPGENQLIKRLDQFLADNRPEIEARLTEATNGQ